MHGGGSSERSDYRLYVELCGPEDEGWRAGADPWGGGDGRRRGEPFQGTQHAGCVLSPRGVGALERWYKTGAIEVPRGGEEGL